MFLKREMKPSTENYSARLKQIHHWFLEADRVVLGIGAGLSAAGGLDYTDPTLAKKWFPIHVSLGFKNISEIQGLYWQQSHCQLERYWGYWAQHIWHIRYETPLLQPYKELYSLVQDKDYFVCTTNADGQVEKAGFPRARIFAPQGDYALFQCAQRCTDTVYENKNMIEQMLAHMPTPTEIRKEDIPYCPRCGAPLCPNLRCDSSFAETVHLHNLGDYKSYLRDSSEKRRLLLELGVGFNTPAIIRAPFEDIALENPKTRLVRINLDHAEVPAALVGTSIGLSANLAEVLRDLNK